MRSDAVFTVTAVTLLALLALATPPITQAAGSGTITGQVTNRTLRRPVPDAEVTLFEMGSGTANQAARGRTDRTGRFRFTGLNPSGARSFLVMTTYRDVPYFSTPLRLTPRGPAASVDVSVFEPTTDPAVVVVAFRIVMIQQVLPGRLVVRDVIGLQSREPRTFVGQRTGAARIRLPPGASNVQIVRGMAPRAVAASAVVDTLPVTPRVREAVLQYEVGYRLTRAAVRWPVDYPTASMDLILPEGIQVREVNLAAQAPGQIRGQRLRRFSAEQLPPGRDVAVALAGLPLNARPYLIALSGIVLTAALLAGLALPLLKKRRAQPPPVRNRLLEAVAQLDGDFERGVIPVEQYRRQREDLIAQLELDVETAAEAGDLPPHG